MIMSAETRFLFETDFSDAEALDRAEPTYNEADLEAARQEAREAAHAEMRGLEENRAAELLAAMAARMICFMGCPDFVALGCTGKRFGLSPCFDI